MKIKLHTYDEELDITSVIPVGNFMYEYTYNDKVMQVHEGDIEWIRAELNPKYSYPWELGHLDTPLGLMKRTEFFASDNLIFVKLDNEIISFDVSSVEVLCYLE